MFYEASLTLDISQPPMFAEKLVAPENIDEVSWRLETCQFCRPFPLKLAAFVNMEF